MLLLKQSRPYGSLFKNKTSKLLGDIDIGRHVNVGAGTIVCSDGQKKHKTIVQSCFCWLRCTVSCSIKHQDYAFVAAGTYVTEDVQENQLAIGRSRWKIRRSQKRLLNPTKPKTYKSIFKHL